MLSSADDVGAGQSGNVNPKGAVSRLLGLILLAVMQ